MSSQVTGDQRRRTVNKPAAAPGYDSEADGDAAARTGAVPMMCLRLVPYWSVHETLGVDAHNAPLKMRTRRIHLSRAVAWSCVRRHPVAGAALGSTDVDGSDPPVRGPGAGSDAGVFSHPCPPSLGVAPDPSIPTREGGLSAASRRRITRSPTGRPSGSRASPSKAGVPPMARATAQAAKSGTRPSQVTDGLPARDCWTGATSPTEGGWACTSNPPRCRTDLTP